MLEEPREPSAGKPGLQGRPSVLEAGGDPFCLSPHQHRSDSGHPRGRCVRPSLGLGLPRGTNGPLLIWFRVTPCGLRPLDRVAFQPQLPAHLKGLWHEGPLTQPEGEDASWRREAEAGQGTMVHPGSGVLSLVCGGQCWGCGRCWALRL